MGFKRTAEGRVFFETPPKEPRATSDIQLAGLLRALNERLKESQHERSRIVQELENLRRTIHDLEGRAERSEQAYIDLEQKTALKQNETFRKADRAEKTAKDMLSDILEARNAFSEIQDKNQNADQGYNELIAQLNQTKKQTEDMRKRQAVLEKMHREQNEKMVDHVAAYVSLTKRISAAEARHESLDNKIGDSALKQTQLERKFEKSNEDRMRLLRKIDRIEETVIQMRDTLNAKAMVVLRDSPAQDIPQSAKKPEALQAREPMVLKDKAQDAAAPWWQSVKIPASVVTGVTALLLVGAVVVIGDAVLPTLKSSLSQKAALDSPFNEAGWQPVSNDQAVVESEVVTPQPAIIYKDPVQDTAVPQGNLSQSDIDDDIGAIDLNDEAALIAALENNPDALATQLNAIEPGDEAEVAAEEIVTAAADPQQDVAPAKPVAKAPTLSNKKTLAERIEPDPNLPKAVKEIEVQAYSGVAEAQHDLAAIYTAGQGGVKTNYERAAQWFREAADGGIANAAYNLGVLYHQGMGVERSLSEALDWYKVAAEKGHPEAQYNLGIAYIEGVGVIYEPVKAAQYFENAATSGIIEAAYNLGLIYENGLLGDAKPKEALKWYKTAADKGSPEAKAALEQLAKTLGIKVEDVNKLVDSTNQKSSASAPAKKAATITAKAAPATEATKADAVRVLASTPQNNQRIVTAKIQRHLMQMGLYPGPADGVSGPLTSDAIRSFQAMSNVTVDGRPSEDLLAFMEEQSYEESRDTGSRAQ